MKNAILLLAAVLLWGACQKNDFITVRDGNEIPEELIAFENFLDLPPNFASYERTLPKYLQVLGQVPSPTHNGKATLGRVLFYDKNLSLDNKVSCGSCHKQALAFSDDSPTSEGINGLKGTRNAMALGNVASFSAHYNQNTGNNALLLWDNRASNVAAQSTLAFLNDHEMGMTMQGVVDRIKAQPYYPYLWKKVYGDFEVSEQKVLDCLSEFVGAIGSVDTRFDFALEKANGDLNAPITVTLVSAIYYGDTTTVLTPIPGMTLEEMRGRDLFVANCSKCHSPLKPFQEVMEACNGLDMSYADSGKGALTGNPADNGVFKSPSLRNIALTAPYMHDGRFATLEEVVDFYSTGVKPHPNLHPAMLHNGSAKLNLSPTEKNQLIAFLNTLTDRSLTLDGRFSDPFKL